jgi:hypothetical protein
LPDAQDGAIGAEKAGKYPASGRVFGVNSGHRTVTGRTADDKRPLDLGKKGVYSSYTQRAVVSRERDSEKIWGHDISTDVMFYYMCVDKKLLRKV